MESRNPENPKKRLLFQEKTFKLKKQNMEKLTTNMFLIFQEMELSTPKSKNLLIFKKEKQNKIYYSFQKKVMKIFFQNYF